MNSNPAADQPPRSDPPASATQQVTWQVLDVGAARVALAAMMPDARVLLVKLDELGIGRSMGDGGWEAMFVQSLLSQLEPRMPEVLRGPGGLELHPSARLAFCAGNEPDLDRVLVTPGPAEPGRRRRQRGRAVSVDLGPRHARRSELRGGPHLAAAPEAA